MKGKECKIIQDLLPSYIDGLTNNETNQFIEEHLNSCDECKNVLDNMKSGIKEKGKSKDKKAFNYFKKYRNKLRILRIILLIIFAIFIVVTVRKYVIISNLQNLSKGIENVSNYYAETHFLQEGNAHIIKSYNKDKKHLTTTEKFDINVNEKNGMTIYTDEEVQITITQSGDIKNARISGQIFGGYIIVHTFSAYDEMLLGPKLLFAITSNISTENLNGRECYFISASNDWKLWVDKETGLIVREINSTMIIDYLYKFDTVTVEDVTKPDISDCNIIEGN